MSKTVDFYFDVGSPTAYLAYTQLPRIAAECKATVVWKPMLLGGVFKATGNASPAAVAAKSRWMRQDMDRWAARYGEALAHNPHFPINTLTLMRGATGFLAKDRGEFLHYLSVIYPAMWQSPRNLGDTDVLAALLRENGVDVDAFVAMVSEPAVKAQLVATTEEAVARGVFGAPTMFVNEQMHFGQDRLEWVRQALTT